MLKNSCHKILSVDRTQKAELKKFCSGNIIFEQTDGTKHHQTK